MAIFELGQHLGHEVEEGVAAHGVGDARLVFASDGGPVDALLVEEAIVLVHDAPEGVEVRVGVGREAVGRVAGGEEEEEEEKEGKNAGRFH